MSTNEAPIDRIRTAPKASKPEAPKVEAPKDTRLRVKFKGCKSTEFVTDPCTKEQAQKLSRKLYPKVISEYSVEPATKSNANPAEPAPEPATESDTRDPEPADPAGKCANAFCDSGWVLKAVADGGGWHECSHCHNPGNIPHPAEPDATRCENVFGDSRCTLPFAHQGPHDNPNARGDAAEGESDAPGSCSRTACTERQQGYKHRHGGRLYCKRCAEAINDANVETLIDHPYPETTEPDDDAGPVEFEDDCPACGGDGRMYGSAFCTQEGCTAAAKLAKLPCDGCNVREPHAHKCHGEPCPCSECREADRIFGGKSDL